MADMAKAILGGEEQRDTLASRLRHHQRSHVDLVVAVGVVDKGPRLAASAHGCRLAVHPNPKAEVRTCGDFCQPDRARHRAVPSGACANKGRQGIATRLRRTSRCALIFSIDLLSAELLLWHNIN